MTGSRRARFTPRPPGAVSQANLPISPPGRSRARGAGQPRAPRSLSAASAAPPALPRGSACNAPCPPAPSRSCRHARSALAPTCSAPHCSPVRNRFLDLDQSNRFTRASLRCGCRPWNFSEPSRRTRCRSQCSGHSASGTHSGYSRAERACALAVVRYASASRGRTRLYSARKRSKRSSCRRPRRLGLQHAVHALVTPVLLRLAGLDPLQLDAQLQPPRGQLAESAGPDRGERAAVVAAQPLRQAVLPEHLLQRSPRVGPDTCRCPAQPSR